MFKLVLRKKDWKWQAFGKHHSESEYLRPKAASPLQRAVSVWMEQGFDLLPEEIKSARGLSWVFWMKGPNGKMLCGRLATSQDRFGRAYPLLLIGEGACGDTLNNWELLPLAGEKSWLDLQQVAEEKGDDLLSMQDRLKLVNPPDVHWKGYQERLDELRDIRIVSGPSESSRYLQNMANVDVFARKQFFSVPFDEEHHNNFYIAAYKFLALLKARLTEEPYMIFMGGAQTAQSLTVLRVPPRAQDFVMIWENAERGQYGV